MHPTWANSGRTPQSDVRGHSKVAITFDAAAEIVGNVGLPTFGQSLMRAGKEVIDADFCSLFAFPSNRGPACLAATGVHSDGAAVQASRYYLSRHWQSDPVLRSFDSHGESGVVHHAFSTQFADERYRRECFDMPNIGDRLTLVFKDTSTLLRLSFYRLRQRWSFGDADIEKLRNAWRLFREATHRHNSLATASGVDPGTGLLSREAVSDRLAKLNGRLSSREIQVCSRILLGLTTEGIALDLDIGVTSVVTYRKRAYSKLGISSQAELFARCLQS